MNYFLIVAFIVFLLVKLPLKVSAFGVGGLLLTTLVIQVTGSVVSGARISAGEAARAIVLSLLLSGLCLLALASFSHGAPRELLDSSMAWTVMGGSVYVAYVLGFRLAMSLTWLHAAIVAVVSTAITSTCMVLLAKALFASAARPT